VQDTLTHTASSIRFEVLCTSI